MNTGTNGQEDPNIREANSASSRPAGEEPQVNANRADFVANMSTEDVMKAFNENRGEAQNIHEDIYAQWLINKQISQPQEATIQAYLLRHTNIGSEQTKAEVAEPAAQ